MSQSASLSKQNRDSAADNQTLFDFLKRKKKYNLQNTVNKSLNQHSHTKKKIDLDLDDSFPQTKEEKTTLPAQYQSQRETRRGVRQNITPKKIDFEDPTQNKSALKQPSQQKANPVQGKSFLSLISPIKNRQRATSDLQVREEQKQNLPKSNKKSVKGGDNFSKKNVTKCINSIKQTMANLTSNIRNIRQKSHGLVVFFNPVLNYLSQSNTPYSRQIGDLRNKLRSFQSLTESIQIDSSDQLIENFHRNLQQHLQFQEGCLKKQLQRTKEQDVQSLKTEKERLISQLQLENKKILKENQLLQRRIEKVENNKQTLKQDVSERQIIYIQQIERLKQQYQSTISNLIAKNQQINQKYLNSVEKAKHYERQAKSERNSRQSIQKRGREQLIQIIQAKDAYLLNEIMVLKSQFNIDINRINELHRVKEAELLERIAKKQEEINKNQFERGCDKQIQSKILQEANQIKQENLHLRNKADCIITDMYRMNEQLYQHWIALKDIKALSTRLGSYAQFKKIFQDLLFNDRLFH